MPPRGVPGPLGPPIMKGPLGPLGPEHGCRLGVPAPLGPSVPQRPWGRGGAHYFFGASLGASVVDHITTVVPRQCPSPPQRKRGNRMFFRLLGGCHPSCRELTSADNSSAQLSLALGLPRCSPSVFIVDASNSKGLLFPLRRTISWCWLLFAGCSVEQLSQQGRVQNTQRDTTALDL